MVGERASERWYALSVDDKLAAGGGTDGCTLIPRTNTILQYHATIPHHYQKPCAQVLNWERVAELTKDLGSHEETLLRNLDAIVTFKGAGGVRAMRC